jgi:thiamine pyrophosphate-dependent acetolactate synthase large subunit-like protein
MASSFAGVFRRVDHILAISIRLTAMAWKYWREWSNPRLIVLVLHYNDLNQVTWELRVMSGAPRFEASQDIPDFPYAKYPESLGLKGVRVDRPDDLGYAWNEAWPTIVPVFWRRSPILMCRRCRRISASRTRRNSFRH